MMDDVLVNAVDINELKKVSGFKCKNIKQKPGVSNPFKCKLCT